MKVFAEKKADRTPTSIKVDPALWKRVRVACVQRGMTQSEVIEGFLRRWIGQETQPERPSPFPDINPDEERLLERVLHATRADPKMRALVELIGKLGHKES